MYVENYYKMKFSNYDENYDENYDMNSVVVVPEAKLVEHEEEV
jgi:hypothetical protein